MNQFVRRLQGSTVRYDVRRYRPALDAIGALESECRALTDRDSEERARNLRERARAGAPLDDLKAPFFALAREASRRAIGQRPVDEQVLAALAMHDGLVVEMATGEGKTLAAVMPAALYALAGRGAHVLTFNDYLARRDAEWMGPIYRRLGLSVAFVQQASAMSDRREAYAADLTYVTAKEAGFDYLRDVQVMHSADAVHRPFHFALVDEADSLLIDEATVPLVLAGAIGHEVPLAPRMAAVVSALRAGLHFGTDEQARNVELTDAGIEEVERLLGCGRLHETANLDVLTAVHCALHARVLLRRDIDYIVRNGRVEIVDEHTGRVVTDRQWPDGLQAALEAREGLARRADGQVLGSVTLQRFLRGYDTLCGMTGTAIDAAEELHHAYGLEVAVIPTHRPVARIDRDDLVFATREAKEAAVVEDVQRAHATGRPVLVGTATVIESERLAERMRRAGVTCAVLNAKHDAEEAAIVARAGEIGAVTISTNMAGRGTDIRLGGTDEADRDRVAALGGLYVIGTNRHESSRVDRQLRGRAGRQGDPGESQCFVSLEDDLLARFGIRDAIHGQVHREIARAQRIAEGQNFEIRRTLARYSAVIDRQHEQFMERRQAVLDGEAVLDEATRLVTLGCLDRAWRDHLAFAAELREGIHLVRMAGEDPLTVFTRRMIGAFNDFNDRVDRDVLDALHRGETGPSAPSSTWTYLINDDPFQHRIGIMLTGPGGVTRAIYAAALLGPLLIAWGLIEKFWRRKKEPRKQ